MPTFGELLKELQLSGGDIEALRKKYFQALHKLTRRNTIIYYSDFLQGANPLTAIDLMDMQGLMEAFGGLKGASLDLIIHSPGGSAEATKSIVGYLRKKFNDVRIFVPLAAMSAATMLALSANQIVMGKHSQLGPIDPQMNLRLPNSQMMATPVRAIIEQFDKAKRECAKSNNAVLGAWTPILQQYGMGLLYYVRNRRSSGGRW